MLSNAYFLAKFRFDTAENEPAKNLQNLLIFPILLTLTPNPCQHRRARGVPCVQRNLRGRGLQHAREGAPRVRRLAPRGRRGVGVRDPDQRLAVLLGCCTDFLELLLFRKMLHFGKIPKIFGQIWRKSSNILAKFAKFWKKTEKNSAIFNENFEIRERSSYPKYTRRLVTRPLFLFAREGSTG